MPTSLREILDQIQSDAVGDDGTPPGMATDDRLVALGELGRALRQLTGDGLDAEPHGRREQLVTELANSCTDASRRAVPTETMGRPGRLAGAAADRIASVRDRLGADQRWALVAGVATAARLVSADIPADHPSVGVEIVFVRQGIRQLDEHMRRDPPLVAARAVLDQPIPRHHHTAGTTDIERSHDAFAAITERLARSRSGEDRAPTLREIFAVTRAAESVTHHAAIAAGRTADHPAAWQQVRAALHPFTAAARDGTADRDLGELALRTHTGLRRAITGPAHRSGPDAEHLRAMVGLVPHVADELASAVTEMAWRRELVALASDLPFAQDRIDEYVSHAPVFAYPIDLAPVLGRLEAAGGAAIDDAARAEAGPIERWRPTVEAINPKLTADPTWPQLATALDRAQAAGYPVTRNLPRLARRAMRTDPDGFPARALRYELVAQSDAAASPEAAATPATPTAVPAGDRGVEAARPAVRATQGPAIG